MSTKIYQIHRMTGEYDDYEDVVLLSYFKKSDAEAQEKVLKDEALEALKQFQKCQDCPFYGLDKNDNISEKMKQYCNNFKMSDDKLDESYCCNEIFDIAGLEDMPTYKIVEEEVN